MIRTIFIFSAVNHSPPWQSGRRCSLIHPLKLTSHHTRTSPLRSRSLMCGALGAAQQ